MAIIKVKGHTRNINGNPKRWVEHDRIIVKKKAKSGNISKNNLIKKKRVKQINRWYASKNYEEDKQVLIDWINNINRKAVVPIKTKNYDYISGFIAEHQDDAIWKNISNDKSSLKHFKIPNIDPSQLIVMVDIDFLIRMKGNQYSDYKKSTVDNVIKKKLKFNDMPIFTIRRGRVDEGNHRVRKMKEMGYYSCPVYIMWK